MQLQINKSQKKGFIGAGFNIEAKIVLTQEEQQLVKQYMLGHLLILHTKMDMDINATAADLVVGESYKCKDLSEVMAYREHLIKAAHRLNYYIKEARNFEGSEIIEIHSTDDEFDR